MPPLHSDILAVAVSAASNSLQQIQSSYISHFVIAVSAFQKQLYGVVL